MDLAELVNPKVSFSKTTLEDILARYTVKNKDCTSTTNKTPKSVKTALSALSQAYARIFGHRPDEDYGDLLWLTLSNLKQASKYARVRLLFEGSACDTILMCHRPPCEHPRRCEPRCSSSGGGSGWHPLWRRPVSVLCGGASTPSVNRRSSPRLHQAELQASIHGGRTDLGGRRQHTRLSSSQIGATTRYGSSSYGPIYK
jgi:hypothetical protein